MLWQPWYNCSHLAVLRGHFFRGSYERCFCVSVWAYLNVSCNELDDSNPHFL